MRLVKYRVTNYRSIDDSGWISAGDITTLVGTNESGKTNLMTPLAKLNPAEPRPIDLMQDMPRKNYHSLRNLSPKPIFISACFKLSKQERKRLTEIAPRQDFSDVTFTRISRDFDDVMHIEFVDAVTDGDFTELVNVCILKIADAIQDAMFDAKRDLVESVLPTIFAVFSSASVVDSSVVKAMLENFKPLDTDEFAEVDEIRSLKSLLSHALRCMTLSEDETVRDYIASIVPKFIYYTNYSNIDSAIYLPQVIQNQQRPLGAKEQSRADTLAKLFKFVNLQPETIVNLGKQEAAAKSLTDEQITELTSQKKEREILLQSASIEFTNRFRNWWKQGNYTIDFQADGDFFRIWISDDIRKDRIELENRSTGLQWFFSFYLTFLTQSEDATRETILLLDEPGLTLHPLAQKDLFSFFEGLAAQYQIIYSTHSPFMVDPSHLSRIVSVYIDKDGRTVASTDLKNSQLPRQMQSVYPVHAALNMSLASETLNGAAPVIVNSVADQIYLTTLKNYLISQGLLRSIREIVFVPCENMAGIDSVLPILVGKNSFMPYVLLSGDSMGLAEAKILANGAYAQNQEKLLVVGNFGIENSTVEDLLPSSIVHKMIVRFIPKSPYAEEEFEDAFDSKLAVKQQIDEFVRKYELSLDPNWQLTFAKRIKAEIIKTDLTKLYENDDARLNAVTSLFTKLSKIQ